MNNNLKKFAIIALASVAMITGAFVTSYGVSAQNDYTSANLIKVDGGGIDQLQLGQKRSDSVSSGSFDENLTRDILDSLTQDSVFRVFGDAQFDNVFVFGDNEFNAINPSSLSSGNPTQADNAVNVGYTSTPPNIAKLQVDGQIYVESLRIDGDNNTYCLCADSSGEFATCGLYDPANGQHCSYTTTTVSCNPPVLDSVTENSGRTEAVVNFSSMPSGATYSNVQFKEATSTTWLGNYGSPNSPRTVNISGQFGSGVASEYRVQAQCSDGTQVFSNVIGVSPSSGSGGACEGTYTTSTSTQKVDWNGNTFNWEIGALYGQDRTLIAQCESANLSFDTSAFTENIQTVLSGQQPYTSTTNQNQRDRYCTRFESYEAIMYLTGPNGNWQRIETDTAYPYSVNVTSNQTMIGNYYQTSGGETRNCSDLTSYGQNYCETNPANSGCTWNPNA